MKLSTEDRKCRQNKALYPENRQNRCDWYWSISH